LRHPLRLRQMAGALTKNKPSNGCAAFH